MIYSIRLSLPLLLIFATIFPSAIAFAQEETSSIFLPSVFGYIEPQAPLVTRPSPYDIDSRNLVIVPADIADNDFEVIQNESVPLTDELRRIGVANGYITYMVSEEENVRNGPFAIGSYAFVFTNEGQARAYFDALKQNYIDDGLSEYWTFGSRAVYVERETIQGFPILYSYGIGLIRNVVISPYSVDLEGARHPSDYIQWMINKLVNLVNGASGAAASDEKDDQAENSTISIDTLALPETFEVILP